MNGMVTVSTEEADIFDSYRECGRWTGPLDPYYTLITCSTVMSGQYVQIQLMANTTLHLYEVEVHGY